MAGYFNSRMSDKDRYLGLASRPPRPNQFSEYRGVTKGHNPKKPYRAALTYQRNRYFLGEFSTELEAARAYNQAALRIIGDFALINDLPEENHDDEQGS